MSRTKSKKMNFQVDNQSSEVQYELCELMSKLPTEVTFNILSRLSILNLSRCRWLSKAWYCTIITMQHNKLIKNNSPCVLLRCTSAPSEEYDFGNYYLVDHESLQYGDNLAVTLIPPRLPFSSKQIWKIHSCNGLVLLELHGDRRLYICNPITGEHNQLPESFMEIARTWFGFDPTTGVLKVIIRTNNNIVGIYSSHVGKWKMIGNYPYGITSNLFEEYVLQNIFVNAALHWLSYSWNGSRRIIDTIISLMFDTVEFKLIPLPPVLDISILEASISQKDRCYLLVLGDSLSFATEVGFQHIEIWVMKEYGLQSSWDKKYIIRDLTIYRPISLMPNGEILTLTMYSRKGKFGFYNHETKVFRSIDIGVHVDEVSLTVSSLISPSAASIVMT